MRPLTLSMPVARIFLMFTLAALLPACISTPPHVTRIASQDQADAALQAIRSEFQVIPRPLIAEIRTSNIDVTSETNAPGVQENYLQRKSSIVLSSAAQTFTARHSKTELITALSPLLYDPNFSADAYIILGYITGYPTTGENIRMADYANSANQGSWPQRRQTAILQLEQNFDNILFALETPEEINGGKGGTLGDTIHTLQSELAALPNPVVRDFVRHPAGTGDQAVAWSEPVLTPPAAAFAEKYPKPLIVAALYPLIHSPVASDRAVVVLAAVLNTPLGSDLEHYHYNLESTPTRLKLDAAARDYLLHGH